jgi:hypothetical protein
MRVKRFLPEKRSDNRPGDRIGTVIERHGIALKAAKAPPPRVGPESFAQRDAAERFADQRDHERLGDTLTIET